MHDLRDAFRALRATPIVTGVAILSLALGIGANTAIFSLLNSLLLRSLPVTEPERLAVVGNGTGSTSWTNPIWEQIRAHQDLFDGALASGDARFDLSEGGLPEFVNGMWVSGSYFDVLGVPAILGRTLKPSDDRRGGGPEGPVAVIGYSFWQRRFGGAASVIGSSITVDRVAFTIVGVTPADFFGTEVGRRFELAIPLGAEPLIRGKESVLDRRSTWWLESMVRLKRGQSVHDAEVVLRGIQPLIRDATMPPDWREEDKKGYLDEGFTIELAAAGSSFLRTRYQRPLTTIMVVVGLVLLIACANIANLLLARANARRHELSVRVALGASHFRIARQLLVESLVLAGSGALLGLGFAQWGNRLLVRQLSTPVNAVYLDLTIDWRILGFTAAIAIATAILFGTAPALRATRVRPNEAIKEQGRAIAGEGRFGPGNLLVVLQVALSLVLVVAAGLFVRTFTSLIGRDLGFDRQPVLVAQVNALRLQLPPADRPEFFERFRRAATQLPGVVSAAASAVTPVSGSTWQFGIERVNGVALPKGQSTRGVYVNLISPEWFSTFGVRMIAGRDIASSDTASAPQVIVVNETFARRFLSGATPIGSRILLESSPKEPEVEREIVGYVADSVYRSIRETVPPTIYVPIPQYRRLPLGLAISVKAAGGSPALLTKSLAATLLQVNQNVTLTLRPLADQINASLIQDRLIAMLSAFFGGLALLLAALGLYGVTAYAVSRRRAEIGIRMALGAAPGRVIRLVLSRVAALVGIGVILGVVVSAWASKFVSVLLYGAQPRDPVTLVGAAIVLAACGAMAGWIPARRASRIDPARVLRE